MTEATGREDDASSETLRAGDDERVGGNAAGTPVMASDPRSLTVDRGAEQSASRGVDEDRAAAEGGVA